MVHFNRAQRALLAEQQPLSLISWDSKDRVSTQSTPEDFQSMAGESCFRPLPSLKRLGDETTPGQACWCGLESW